MKHICSVFLFQPRPLSAWSTGKKAVFWLWNTLILVAAAAGITSVMLLLAVGDYSLRIVLGYFTHPILFVLNFLPVLLLMALGWAVTGRSWGAYLFGAVPALALAYGNYFKMVFRNDPVVVADLLILAEAGDMATKYELYLNGRMLLVAGCAIAGFLVLFFFAKARPGKRLRLSVLAAVILALVFGAKPYLSDTLYNATEVNLDLLNRWGATNQHISRGNLYPFLYSANEAFPAPPEGYDEDETEALLEEYEDADIPEEEKVNVVGLMLEAFADFSVKFDTIEYTRDVYALYHALEAESYTGTLVDNIFAGGTINTERAFLTGCSTLYNWRTTTDAYPWYFKSQGYDTSGDHPCYEWFYNRENINSYLGFDSYRFVGNHYESLTGGIAMDDVFFPELTADLLSRLESDRPQFSFSVTYQGHGPYDGTLCQWGEVEDFIANEELDEESRTILANYLGSVEDTQKHLTEFVDTLRALDEPVVLIVFGDHMPWLGNANSVYTALGANLDLSTQEGFYNYWSTRYLIWANDAAREVLDFDFTGEGPDLSPCFLMGHLFDRLGWEGDAYTQATAELRGAVTVLHDNGRYVEHGVFTDVLTAENQALLTRFRHLEHYRAR